MSFVGRIRGIIDPVFQAWEDGLRLTKSDRLRHSLIHETADYYSIPFKLAMERCSRAGFEVNAAWSKVNFNDPRTVANFYRNNDWYNFELVDWHTASGTRNFLDIVLLCQILDATSFPDYLDYGCGIGSHGIFMAKRGFGVTIADVSKSSLAFCRWRFHLRSLHTKIIDISSKGISGFFDIITVLDVLEHIQDPKATISMLSSLLKPRGLLVITIPPVPLPFHSMHFQYYKENLLADARSAGLVPVIKLSSLFLFARSEAVSKFIIPHTGGTRIRLWVGKSIVRPLAAKVFVPMVEYFSWRAWRFFEALTWIPVWIQQTALWFRFKHAPKELRSMFKEVDQ